MILSRPLRDKTHVDWVKAYVSIWTDLQSYIKQHHTTGLTWSKTVSYSPERSSSHRRLIGAIVCQNFGFMAV